MNWGIMWLWLMFLLALLFDAASFQSDFDLHRHMSLMLQCTWNQDSWTFKLVVVWCLLVMKPKGLTSLEGWYISLGLAVGKGSERGSKNVDNPINPSSGPQNLRCSFPEPAWENTITWAWYCSVTLGSFGKFMTLRLWEIPFPYLFLIGCW